MQQFSIEYIRCVKCGSKLELEIFGQSNEIEEGLLVCHRCDIIYPIISKIPILWPNFISYLSNRAQVGGYMMNKVRNSRLESLVKNSLRKIRKDAEDVSRLEKQWVTTYTNSTKSKFYSHIKKSIRRLPKAEMVLEHGCSIGYITRFLAQKNDIVFGMDQSYFAILKAKKNNMENLDFFVANSLYPPFGRRKFDLVVALNVLELIEPLDFLHIVTEQTKGIVMISDPYDFERGKNSVKTKIDSKMLRDKLEKLGFVFIHNTKRASFLPWKLKINPRLDLHYKVDLVIAKNSKNYSY